MISRAVLAAVLVAFLWLVALSAAPVLAAPVPRALSPVNDNNARLQNYHTENYLKLRDGEAPVTTTTTRDESRHFDLTVRHFMDSAMEHLWAVRSLDANVYLVVDEQGARSDTLSDNKLNKDEAKHVLFRKKETTCDRTVAFESVADPGKFMTEQCPTDPAAACSLRLAPMDTSAADNSVCLDSATQQHVPNNVLFKESPVRS